MFKDNYAVRKIVEENSTRQEQNTIVFSFTITFSCRCTDYIPGFLLSCFSQETWSYFKDAVVSSFSVSEARDSFFCSSDSSCENDLFDNTHNMYHERNADGYVEHMPIVSGYS